MRTRELFTIPEGKKITEKMFGRVLFSSVCSILLCMACLVGTTWAWFTVSVENEGNEIQIATVTQKIKIMNGGTEISPADGTYTLEAGNYGVEIQLDNNATGTDALNKTQRTVYVLMTVTQNDVSESYFLAFAGAEKNHDYELQIGSNTAEIRFSVSWIKPASATLIGNEAVVIDEISTKS